MPEMLRAAAAIDLVGFAHVHEQAFQQVADEWDCVIISRAPGWVCQQLIEEGYGSKGFHVKAKSCDWGPAAGFILEDIRLTKSNDLEFQYKEIQERIKYKPNDWRTPLLISNNRVKFLDLERDRLNIEQFKRYKDEKDNDRILIRASRPNYTKLPIQDKENVARADKYRNILEKTSIVDNLETWLQRNSSQQKNSSQHLEMEFILIKKDRDIWGVYFADTENPCQEEMEREYGLVPVMALTDPLNPILSPEHKSAITGDYDLFAIFPRDQLITDAIGYEKDQLDLRIARIDEKSNFDEGHPDYGHVHQRIMLLIEALNRSIYKQDVRAAYSKVLRNQLSKEIEEDIEKLVKEVWIQDETKPISRKEKDPLKESRHALPPIRKMVHHNDEGGRPQAPGIEYPLIGFVPGQKRAFGLGKLDQLKDFLKVLVFLGFKIPINPSWRADLGSLGNDIFVPGEWANSWEKYKFGVQETKQEKAEVVSMAYSTKNTFSSSSETPTLLNGMKVIFDQPASVFSVSLSKKTSSLLSAAQSLSGAFAAIENINWDLQPSVFETKMQENPFESLRAKKEVPSVKGQNESNAIVWFNTIFSKGNTTDMKSNADQERVLKQQQDFFKRHFLAMAIFGVKGGNQKKGDYKPIEEFRGVGGIPALATLSSGGGRLNYQAQDGDIGDEFFIFLTLGTSPSLNLRRGIKSQEQLDALFDGIAASEQGTVENFPANLPKSHLGLYKSRSTHAEDIDEDGTIKEEDVWYGFQDALHFDFPVGGRGHTLKDYKGREVRTDYQGHSWAARRNQSSLTKIIGVVDEEKHYQTGSALLRHRRRENGASNTMVAFEGSAPWQDNIFGGGHGVLETIKKKLTSYQSERTLTGQSKRDKLGLPGGKGGMIAEVTEEGLAQLKAIVDQVNSMDILQQENFFKKLLFTTTAQERRSLLSQFSRSGDILESKKSSADVLERKPELPDNDSESDRVVRLHF